MSDFKKFITGLVPTAAVGLYFLIISAIYIGHFCLKVGPKWVPTTSIHPMDTVRALPIPEVARTRSRTSPDTLESHFGRFWLT